MTHRIVVFFRRLIEACRHVETGGRTTRNRAVRKAAAPAPRCPSCHQQMKHSTDWRDHLH